jgi:hypothetical protein
MEKSMMVQGNNLRVIAEIRLKSPDFIGPEFGKIYD